ncbi:MAG TPA: TIGR04076 family protein [Phototrophicaceae bacterium]|nr:TIGR04076 family protein [Phototrophicaceae bacterium]
MACKITVLKRMINADLAEEYIANPVTPCPFFQDGQEFITPSLEKPAGFCDWAWNDIHKVIVTLRRGGNFSDGMFEGWMKNDTSMIACCTDGVRPVVFKIEEVEG